MSASGDTEMGRNARRLGEAATTWMDTRGDPEVRLLRRPGRAVAVRTWSARHRGTPSACAAAPPPAEVAARLAALTRSPADGGEWLRTVIDGSPPRVATSWIGPRDAIGAQDAAGTGNGAGPQHCPLVVHWPGPAHEVSWLRVAPATPVDAAVDADGVLRVTRSGAAGERLCFEVYAPHADLAEVTGTRWRLPGLTVRPDTPAGVLAARSVDPDRVRTRAAVIRRVPVATPFRRALTPAAASRLAGGARGSVPRPRRG